jgi:hypothetical protein
MSMTIAAARTQPRAGRPLRPAMRAASQAIIATRVFVS